MYTSIMSTKNEEGIFFDSVLEKLPDGPDVRKAKAAEDKFKGQLVPTTTRNWTEEV